MSYTEELLLVHIILGHQPRHRKILR